MEDSLRFVKDMYPELKEKLMYRRYINQEYEKKKAQGWDEVHNSIKSAPYCGRYKQIANIFFCHKCMHRAEIYRCALCDGKAKRHYLKYPGFNNNVYDPCFIRLFPDYPSWCDKLRKSYTHLEIKDDPYSCKYGGNAR